MIKLIHNAPLHEMPAEQRKPAWHTSGIAPLTLSRKVPQTSQSVSNPFGGLLGALTIADPERA